MKILRCCFALLVSAFTLGAFAQSAQQIKNDKNTYIYGEGSGVTEAQADEAAIADLLSKISISVKTDFISNDRQYKKNGVADSETEFQQTIKSYSAATLNNTERMLISQEPDAKVLRYIKRDEVDKIFKSRQDKAIEFVRLGEAALAKNQIDDALRYFYWSLCLARSLRYPANAKYNVDGVDQTLVTWLPQRIESICTDISLRPGRRTDDGLILGIYHKDKPVRSMDYSYNLGQGYGAIYSARDGQGIIELLPDDDLKSLTIKVEFEFRGLTVIDREVESAMHGQADVFRKAYISVPMDDAVAQQKPHTAPAATKKTSSELSSSSIGGTKVAAPSNDIVMSAASSAEYATTMQQIHEALVNRNLAPVQKHFTTNGFAELKKILAYGRYTVGKDCSLQFYSDDLNPNEVTCRGLDCTFHFGNRRVFNEQLTFSFDKGKIAHVSLGLGNQMSDEEIFCHNNWGTHSRKKLASFLEDYRTAYAMKDADYLERVFDDNAVIIVGKVLQAAPTLNQDLYQKNRYVQQTRYTKEEFIKNVKRNFLAKEYINLHFSNCEVVKLGNEEVYGIQVKQDYYSSNYGDSGYLYLMVDLKDPKQPIIHVRTWQDNPLPDIGVIGPGDF